MSADNPIMVLDTNVWLDSYLDHREGTADARALITFAIENDITLAYAATSTKDVFYIVASEMKYRARKDTGALSEEQARACTALAWGCIENMASVAVAAPVGEPQVWLARHYRSLHNDYEDDLILAAVETSKADYLVTNDQRLMGKSPAPAFTSADMLAYLQL